jgi:hypothetical protein
MTTIVIVDAVFWYMTCHFVIRLVFLFSTK